MTETLPKKMHRKVQAKIDEHAARIRRWARGNIDAYSEWLKSETAKFLTADEKAAEDVTKWAEALSKLRRAGFKVKTTECGLDLKVVTTRKKLTAVYQAIGRLDPQSVCKDIADPAKKLVRVSINSVQYPFVTVVYDHKLRDTDKCRIESVTVPEHVEHRLVCEK